MRSLRFLILALAFGGLAAIGSAQTGAATWSGGGFTQALSAQDLTDAGLAKLSADEATFLNSLVAREVSLARAGNVSGFAGTFVGRRSAEDRAKAGLDHLSPTEQARLNNLVAVALAAGPVRPETGRTFGKESLSIAQRLQIHGEVSLTVGTSGKGRNFYDTSFFTTITDPATNLTIGIGYEQFKGSGWFGYGPDDYYDYTDFGLSSHGFGPGGCVRRR